MTNTLSFRGLYGDISADEFCYERGSNTSTCDLTSGKCQTAAQQYYDKVVLGISAPVVKQFNESHNYLEALSEVGSIGTIKWDITLCLLLSWTVVCLCLIKGKQRSNTLEPKLQLQF